MEARLDKIANGGETCYDLCKECSDELQTLIKSCKKKDDDYSNNNHVQMVIIHLPSAFPPPCLIGISMFGNDCLTG